MALRRDRSLECFPLQPERGEAALSWALGRSLCLCWSCWSPRHTRALLRRVAGEAGTCQHSYARRGRGGRTKQVWELSEEQCIHWSHRNYRGGMQGPRCQLQRFVEDCIQPAGLICCVSIGTSRFLKCFWWTAVLCCLETKYALGSAHSQQWGLSPSRANPQSPTSEREPEPQQALPLLLSTCSGNTSNCF